MNDVLPELRAWQERGVAVALATVVEVRRSAPRQPGAKMAINERGEIAGSVSGGCVEGAVVEIAERVLSGEHPRLLHFGIADSDAWEIGLPCGGEIDVWVQRHETDSALEVAAARGERLAEVTLLEGAACGAKLTVAPDGAACGSLGSPDLDQEAARVAAEQLWKETSERHGRFFVDVVAPPPPLILFGAVDVAKSLCRIARECGWRPFVVDPRSRFATPERFPEAERVIASWPKKAFEQLGGIDRATSIAVLTHDPKLDDAALALALRSPARFVGAMGSRRAQEARRERLRELGLTDEELGRLAAPLGLDLGASDRGETALSIMSEVVAARHGRDGGRLATATGRIHRVPA